MPIVLPETTYTCHSPAAAEAFAGHLVDVEELRDITFDTVTCIVTVPGMDLAGAIEIAELGVRLGHMSDAAGAAAIRAIENADKRWVDGRRSAGR